MSQFSPKKVLATRVQDFIVHVIRKEAGPGPLLIWYYQVSKISYGMAVTKSLGHVWGGLGSLSKLLS